MSVQIRRHSIISSLVIYFGFAIGALNTYLFTKEGLFTEEQYGLTTFFLATTTLMVSFASIAMPSFIYKFYPYYNDHLEPRKNDMLAWSLVTGIIGFLIVLIVGIVFQYLFDRKYSAESPLAVTYYYWMFPFAFGLNIYNILESYAWNLNKSILTNFLKEVQLRIFTTILIVLFVMKVIPDFDLFIKLYSFIYPGIAFVLLLYLMLTKKIHLTFHISKVTRRFFKKITRFIFFVYSGSLIFNISLVFDSLVISSIAKDGLKKLAIFTLAQFLTSIIQAPQRGIIAASTPHISKAWKDKRIGSIQKIYQRSSINQLVFSCLLFTLIALNYTEAILTFKLKDAFLLGFYPFIFLGLTRLIDMGTGLNAQIIGTSTYWKFELISGAILLALILPLNYFLTKKFDIMGPAIANLVSVTVYNAVRIQFLWKKFRLFPFTDKSLYTLVFTAMLYFFGWLLFHNLHGFPGLFARSIFVTGFFIAGVYLLKLTPDFIPVVQSLFKRFRKS